MIDAVTKEPIRVSIYHGAWPYIRFPLEQFDEVKKRLDRAGIRYDVDKYALSYDGNPYTVGVHFDHRAEVAAIQAVLDECQTREIVTSGTVCLGDASPLKYTSRGSDRVIVGWVQPTVLTPFTVGCTHPTNVSTLPARGIK
jgi:hypothetical protein